ncbi:hypothetical protein Poli38472_011828 [Pythium oligandrum]|uniref:Calpain catalytic domain-containing protein n=1 Tax=Pythium oligandrum TaxID=41045 RepID=A0A8K1C862_PYTOL|nr:hypothetical protein Poli38472_011828 [Pythium oligandrum]|eukprot:TMW58240.1 hypothetical protein Poli38472_011828 [Pythium oligandrum]
MQRRASTVEELYGEAFGAAERGKALEREGGAHATEAAACFQEAIRIFKRLAIVESAAKRELVQSAIKELQERVARLEQQPDALLARAMEIHSAARDEEAAGDTTQCIESYLSAGDWYMKAYAALPPDEVTSRDAVREQIEYIITHVSQLKVAVSEPVEERPEDVGAMAWPAPPTESPDLSPCGLEASSLPQELKSATTVLTEEAWPMPPLDPQNPASTEASPLESLAWPSLPLSYNGGTVDELDWPLPPAPSSSKRREMRRQMTASGRISSANALLLNQPAVSSGPTSAKARGESEDMSTYSPAELDVLRRSSLINGHLFVPWLDDVDSHEDFRSAHLFVDPDGLVPLSAKQVRKGASWLRPSEYAQLCGFLPVMIDTISPHVVKQDIVTDCSFVASLCIAAAYEQRFHKPLITNIIFPVDPRTKQPMYNPSGKYIVKLWANGVPRKVVIDDFLPVNPETRELLCSCTTRKNELWVTLIEKAYLKLCGGYDYPGGNSGIDLFALTGWIPERIAIADLMSDPTREDRLWEQLKSAFHFGDCIITMTTGDIGSDAAQTVGLVPMHVYAVLNVFETTVSVENEAGEEETKRLRLLHVKNPWRKLSWKGPYSRSDTATWLGPIGQELRDYEMRQYGEVSSLTSEAAGDEKAVAEDDGLFWIDLESVKVNYESLYLNWNPALFPHTYVIHEHWPVSLGPANDFAALAYNPQYSLRFRRRSASEATRSTVWVLLSRHVSTVERDSESTPLQFLTLHVYRDTNGKRVFYNQADAMYRGTYSNNPHTLVSLDVNFAEDPEPTFTLVASQYEKFAPLDYTLSVFSTAPFLCRPVPHLDAIPNTTLIPGEWDAVTAGGRPFFASFMKNPQFHVRLNPRPQRLYVVLETVSAEDETVVSLDDSPPVNLRVVTQMNERVCGLAGLKKRPSTHVLSSGEYRHGFCFIEIDAEDAEAITDLVLIPSTFEANITAKFRIRLIAETSDAVVGYRGLPQEGVELVCTELEGRWDPQRGTAVGCASYGCYTFNPKYLVQVTDECVLFARLTPVQAPDATGTTLPSVNVSIYPSNAQGNLLLSTHPKASWKGATSDEGVYTGGNPSGVMTPYHVVFLPGWYVIIPSTYDPLEFAYTLRIYSSKLVNVRQLT